MPPTLLDARRFPYIGLIRSFFPRRVKPFVVGSGTLIGPRVVLTAAHVVYDHFRGGYTEFVDVTLGDQQRPTIKTTLVRTTRQWVEEDSKIKSPISAFDFGVIALPARVDVTPLEFEATQTSQLQTMTLNVAGYPVRHYADMYGAHAGAIVNPELSFRVFYAIETLAGMSGGPAFSIDQQKNAYIVRGIHTSIVGSRGCALRITDNVSALLLSWLNEFQ